MAHQNQLECLGKTCNSFLSESKRHVVQGIARLEGEVQAVRALLGNSSTIVAALREIATPSTATRYILGICQLHYQGVVECEADSDSA